MIQRFVWRDGQFVDPKTGTPMEKRHSGIQAPMVMRSDFEPYRSCITGQVVDGQRARREEIAIAKDKDMVPYERVTDRPPGLINKEFARRGGRRVSEATVEWASNKRKATAVKKDASGALIVE